MMVPYYQVLVLAGLLFALGLVCLVARRGLLMILVGVEVMLNAAGLALVGASLRWMALDGQVAVLMVMTVAGAEITLGLALVLRLRHRGGGLGADDYQRLRD